MAEAMSMVVSDGGSAGPDMGFWRGAYDAHAPAVLAFLSRRLGSREDAEDLLQETFVRAIRAASFRPEGNLRAYLLRTARNLIVNRLRRPRIEVLEEAREELGEPFAAVASDGASPEEEAAWRAFGDRLARTLGRLTAAHRTAFELAVLEQRSYAEVAQLTGWTLSQVKINLYRARKRILDELGEALPLPGR